VNDILVIGMLPLAAYYVTWLITHSKIADPIMTRWQAYWERRWITKHAKNEHEAAVLAAGTEWNSKLAYLVTCPWCTGYWVSLGFVLAVLPFTDLPVWPLWPLILLYMSALIGIIDSLTHREA
jgi:hypothetical protein